MRTQLLAASAALVMMSGSALAQSTVIVEEAPAVTGSRVVVPGDVRTYVMEREVPSVVYEGDVVVGSPLPETVEVHRIDGHDGYAYSVVNERRVLIDPQTRSVIEVLD